MSPDGFKWNFYIHAMLCCSVVISILHCLMSELPNPSVNQEHTFVENGIQKILHSSHIFLRNQKIYTLQSSPMGLFGWRSDLGVLAKAVASQALEIERPVGGSDAVRNQTAYYWRVNQMFLHQCSIVIDYYGCSVWGKKKWVNDHPCILDRDRSLSSDERMHRCIAIRKYTTGCCLWYLLYLYQYIIIIIRSSSAWSVKKPIR